MKLISALLLLCILYFGSCVEEPNYVIQCVNASCQRHEAACLNDTLCNGFWTCINDCEGVYDGCYYGCHGTYLDIEDPVVMMWWECASPCVGIYGRVLKEESSCDCDIITQICQNNVNICDSLMTCLSLNDSKGNCKNIVPEGDLELFGLYDQLTKCQEYCFA